jgi:hypothetical protein
MGSIDPPWYGCEVVGKEVEFHIGGAVEILEKAF